MTPLNLPAPTAQALERLAAELGLEPAEVASRCIAFVVQLRALAVFNGFRGDPR